MEPQWRIEMFGGLQVCRGETTISRFKTHKTAGLLAYLAFYTQRVHTREALIALLWPDAGLEQGRPSLSVALSSLRQQLEPPGTPARSVLITSNTEVRLNPGGCASDTAEFESLIMEAGRAAEGEEGIVPLTRAVELYRGDLLPGHYDDWCFLERSRLQHLYIEALRRLVRQLVQKRQLTQAFVYVERAIGADPLREELHRDLMQLYAGTGQPSAALNHYRDLEARWQREVREPLSPATHRLARKIAEGLQKEPQNAPPPAEERGERQTAKGESLTPNTEIQNPKSKIQNPTLDPRYPIPYSRYFGREKERAHLAERLTSAEARLLTLTGPGGIGKTRLAIEVARQTADYWQGAVWFVALEALLLAEHIPETIVEAMRLPRTGSAPPLALLREALSRQPSLLVLDNIEQMGEEAAPVIRRLLTEIPTLCCLVTSRRRLNLEEEEEFPVRPLPVAEESGSLAALLASPAASLFIDRAQSARPDFEATEQNAAAIGALCERLEGLPLALELAAARAPALSPAQMLGQLERGSAVLVNRRKEAPERHRSLRAAFAWSYDLLPPEHQQFLAGLSVFRGGWTLEAAETVCNGTQGESFSFLTLDMLMDLQEASLILVEEREGKMRFRMLEFLREYAAERLTPEEQLVLSERHTDCFLSLAEEAETPLSGPEQERWLRLLELERDNFGAALNACIENGEAEKAESASVQNGCTQGLRLAVALRRFWDVRGYYTEGYRTLNCLLALPAASVPGRLRAVASNAAGSLAFRLGNYSEAHAFCEEALAFYRQKKDSQGTATTLNTLGLILSYSDPAAAQVAYEEGLALQRTAGNRIGEAYLLNNMGLNALNREAYAEARGYYAASLPLLRELGDRRGLIHALRGLGSIANRQGDNLTGELFFQEAQTLAEALGDRSNLGWATVGMAYARKNQKDFMTAAALFEAAVKNLREIGEQEGLVEALYGWGGLAQDTQNYTEARIHYHEALRIALQLGLGKRVTEIQTDLARLAQMISSDPEPSRDTCP